MTALPEGTVTFLFTDIEGSTALLRELGDDYADVLARHHQALRGAVEDHEGVVMGSEGDALFVAFASAPSAVSAAAEAQQALADLGVRVRMGVHTGHPTVHEGNYVGLDVHRAARIAAAGHGGQVLLSHTTRGLLDDRFVVRDLGEHRLKDLPDAEWLFQLGEAEFAPLRSLSNTNLPVPPNPLVGRERELADLVELMRRGDSRLVTVTGPGGMGKTRLVLAAAAELVDVYPNGVFFVPLATVADSTLVTSTIAQTLGAAQQGGEPIEATLARKLEDRTLLLVLDNLEQVIDVAPRLAELLERAPELRILSTSREPLRIRGEREYALPPLSAEDALALFLERAQAVRSDFVLDGDEPAAREICERLDRLPLAVELAAARVKLLSPRAMLERLQQRLTFVASSRRDLPERHRTLRGAIEWSHDLLAADERTLFGCLAVFAGGWTLEAAETVCDADLDTLASLLDKSLVTRDDKDDRFSMLATIREYGLERLAAREDAEAVRRAHAEHFLGIARDAEATFDGPGQVDALQLLEREHDNVRAALGWALDADGALAIQLAGALGAFWYKHTHVLEGAAWLERAIDVDDGRDPAARARAAHSLGVLNDLRRDGSAARRWLEEAVALYRETNDVSRLTRAMNSLGIVSRNSGDLARARELLAECLAMRRELGDRTLISVTTCDLGIVAFDEGDLDAAGALFEESLAIDRELGDKAGVAINTGNLGWLALERGQVDRAAELIQQALRGFIEVGDREGLAEALEQAAALEGRRGRRGDGARLAGAAAALREAVGVPWASVYDRRRIERELDAMRAELGEGAFRAAYEDGRGADVEQAAEEALARLDPARA
jgi:predicted ATPase